MLFALFMAVFAYCLSYAAAVLGDVNEQKGKPFELVVTAQKSAGISQQELVQIGQLQGVENESAVIRLQATVESGKYKADLFITGIGPEYIDGEYETGGGLPKGSAMPYLVLNRAACKLFSDGSQSVFGDKTADIDFLAKTFVLKTGKNSSVSCRISGILMSTEDEAPLAYMDNRTAQNLLLLDGQEADPTEAFVRLTNSGYAKGVSDELADMGFEVMDTNKDAQAGWDMMSLKGTNFVIMGAFCLLCAALVLPLWKRVEGMPTGEDATTPCAIENDRSRFYVKSVFCSWGGILLGYTAALITPLLLLPDALMNSVFALPVPLYTLGIAAILACACSLPALVRARS